MAHQQLVKQESFVSEVLSNHKKQLRKNIERHTEGHLDISNQEGNQESSISQIIRSYGKLFRQIRKQYTDGVGGRCVMGVLMSYYGWDGKCISNAERKLYATLCALRQAGINKELLIELNDSGATFDEIADYLDNIKNR